MHALAACCYDMVVLLPEPKQSLTLSSLFFTNREREREREGIKQIMKDAVEQMIITTNKYCTLRWPWVHHQKSQMIWVWYTHATHMFSMDVHIPFSLYCLLMFVAVLAVGYRHAWSPTFCRQLHCISLSNRHFLYLGCWEQPWKWKAMKAYEGMITQSCSKTTGHVWCLLVPQISKRFFSQNTPLYPKKVCHHPHFLLSSIRIQFDNTDWLKHLQTVA